MRECIFLRDLDGCPPSAGLAVSGVLCEKGAGCVRSDRRSGAGVRVRAHRACEQPYISVSKFNKTLLERSSKGAGLGFVADRDAADVGGVGRAGVADAAHVGSATAAEDGVDGGAGVVGEASVDGGESSENHCESGKKKVQQKFLGNAWILRIDFSKARTNNGVR